MDFIQKLDNFILYYINTVWTNPWLSDFFPVITDLHKQPWFKIVVIPLMLGLCLWKYRQKGVLVFACLLLTLGMTDLIGNRVFKKTIERPRPGDVPGNSVIVRSPYGGYSFVSNHAANMFGFATYTGVMFPQAKIPLYAVATLIGYSRMYNGVHYPTDVLGGGLLGYFIGKIMSCLCQFGLARWSRKKMKT